MPLGRLTAQNSEKHSTSLQHLGYLGKAAGWNYTYQFQREVSEAICAGDRGLLEAPWPDLQQGLHISRQFATAHSNSCHIQVSCAVTPSALDSSLTCTAVCLRVEKRTERSLGKQILTQLKRQTNSSGPPEIPYPSVTVGAEESVLCSHED